MLAAFIWSGNFIIARNVRDDISPIGLAFFRWLTASALLLPFAFRSVKAEWSTIRISWQYLFWVALTGIALFNTFVYIGAHHTSAINLTLIGTTTSPIVATLLAWFFLKESVGWFKLGGLLLCISGVLLLLAKGNFENLLHLKFSKGDLWVMTAAFCFAIYNTMVKKKPKGISALSFLLVIFSIGTLLLLPFYLWDLCNAKPLKWNSTLIFSIGYLSLGASVICFWIWNIAIGKIGAVRTILFGNLIPIFGTIGSVVLLHEQFTWVHVASMAIVFAGIILANLQAFRRR